MLSSILQEHFRKVSELYSQITPGQATSREDDSEADTELKRVLSSARGTLNEHASMLDRERPVKVAIGGNKGAWAHVYYVSFHDPVNSDSPREGFYPVFLMSVDQRQCYLALSLAAASVGISGRGGWSNKRGAQLRQRAEFLGRNLNENDGWRKGPLFLGTAGGSLHADSGSEKSAARAYECCSIISKQFNPHDPPNDLTEWLKAAFSFFDEIYRDESEYFHASIIHQTEEETHEQANAAITGEKAEKFFMEWAPEHHPEWGAPVSKTDKVGLGYDIDFPDVGLKVEVKGCREGIQDIRVTKHEWKVAEETGNDYLLAVVSNLNNPENQQVKLIRNPFRELRAVRQQQLQITYRIQGNALQQHAGED